MPSETHHLLQILHELLYEDSVLLLHVAHVREIALSERPLLCKEFLIQSWLRQLAVGDLVGALDEDSRVGPLASYCHLGVTLEVPLTSLGVEEAKFLISIRV